jgi:hypothetical protein
MNPAFPSCSFQTLTMTGSAIDALKHCGSYLTAGESRRFSLIRPSLGSTPPVCAVAPSIRMRGVCKIVMTIVRDMSVPKHENFSADLVEFWPDVAVAGEERYERLRFYTDPLTLDSLKPAQRGAMQSCQDGNYSRKLLIRSGLSATQRATLPIQRLSVASKVTIVSR